MSGGSGQLSAEGERLLALRLSGLGGATPLPQSAPGSDRQFPLSLDQQRLWFIDQANPGILAYNVHGAYRLRGELDVAALRSALRFVMVRHQVLCARFLIDASKSYQLVGAPPDDVLSARDFSSEPDPLIAAREFARSHADVRFVLAEGRLFRAWLARLGHQDHALGFVVHHIVFDRDSLDIWEAEVSAAYAAFRAGDMPRLPPLTAQYGDYAQWQRREAGRGGGERQLDYWRHRLRGVPVAMDLPLDHPRPKQPSYRAGSVPVRVPPGRACGLRALARRQRTTTFTVALAGLQGLLFRYGPAADTVVVGSPVNGRARAEFEGLIGFFTRSLPITASRPEGIDPSFSAMVSQARDALLEAHANQEVPFDEIVRLAAPPRDLGQNPLFQIWFDLVTQPPAGAQVLSLPGVVVTEFDAERIRTRFDLELHLVEEATGELSGRLLFATDLFDPATARAFALHYENFLSAVAGETDMRLSQIPILAAEEQHTILNEWGVAR